jgi:hypothetical protein
MAAHVPKRELFSRYRDYFYSFLMGPQENAQPMKTLDEYRRNARECQRMADNVSNPADKASWLRLAASWLGMIKNQPERPFANDAKEARNSSEKWPDASHEDSQASH